MAKSTAIMAFSEKSVGISIFCIAMIIYYIKNRILNEASK